MELSQNECSEIQKMLDVHKQGESYLYIAFRKGIEAGIRRALQAAREAGPEHEIEHIEALLI